MLAIKQDHPALVQATLVILAAASHLPTAVLTVRLQFSPHSTGSCDHSEVLRWHPEPTTSYVHHYNIPPHGLLLFFHSHSVVVDITI